VHACPHHDCLMTITPEEVFNAIVRIRDEGSGGSRSAIQM